MSSTGWLTRTTSSVILMVLLAVGSAAQDKPDFAGRWILESPSQPTLDIPIALTVRQSMRRTTGRGEPMTPYFNEIEIDRELPDGIHSETYEIGIIGGLVPGFEDGRPAGPRLHHSVQWEGDALAFESGSDTGQAPETGIWTERREVWSFDAAGRLRAVITTRSSSEAPKSVTLLYRRRD